MTQSLYLRPIALAESPQSEEGAAIRIAGGLVYASRFAVIVREGARIVSRECYGVRELEAALPGLPTEAGVVRKGYGDLDAAFRLERARQRRPSICAESRHGVEAGGAAGGDPARE